MAEVEKIVLRNEDVEDSMDKLDNKNNKLHTKDFLIQTNDEVDNVVDVREKEKDTLVMRLTEKIKKQTLDQSKLLGYVGLALSLGICLALFFLYPIFASYLGESGYRYGYAFLIMLPYLLLSLGAFVCLMLCKERKKMLVFKFAFVLSIIAITICIFIPIWCLICNL